MRPDPISALPAAVMPRRSRIFARSQGEFSARVVDGVTEILLSGEVGFDNLTESAVRDQLAGAGPVRVRINSPGGSAFEGVAIHNAIVGHSAPVTTEVSGLAASAASIIAMAGDRIEMAAGSHLMIHRSWGLTVGNESDHLQQAAVLQGVDRSLAEIYAARSGKTVNYIGALMDAETWFSADEAVSAGLADAKVSTSRPAALFDLSGVYRNTPAQLKRPPSKETVAARSPDELRRILIERAGMTRGAAERIAAGGWRALSGDSDEITTLCASVTAVAEELRSIRGSK